MFAEPLSQLAAMAVAGHGLHDPDRPLWSAWNVDPELLVPVALAASFYLRGLARWPEPSRPHPPWRTASYLGGLALVVVAIESPLDVLGQHHFTFHMLQHELLLMVAAPLILLGAPTTPTLRGMPRWLRLGVVRRLARRTSVRWLYRAITHPLLALALLTTMLWAWHLVPGWYDAALRDELLHDVQHLSYAVAGVLFWWGVIDPAPLRSRMSYPLRMVYLLVGGTPKHFLAALITFAGDPLYDIYSEVAPIVALTLKDDQSIGGLIMWAPSQMMHLAVIAAVFFVWFARSEREQLAREAEQLAVTRLSEGGVHEGDPT